MGDDYEQNTYMNNGSTYSTPRNQQNDEYNNRTHYRPRLSYNNGDKYFNNRGRGRGRGGRGGNFQLQRKDQSVRIFKPNKSDQLHQIYSDQKIKQILIDYIYNTIEIYKYNYKVLNTRGDLNYINSSKYIITPNYHGYNYLMIFMRNKDRYYSYIVDRKTLTYNRDQINLDTINIIPFELDLDNKIYDGTIFDGIYHFDTENKYFIINDVYRFRGDNVTGDIIKYKLINVNSYLQHYNINKNNFELSVNVYSEFKGIKEAIEKYKNGFYKIQVRGICFYPYVSGTKLIYTFDNFNKNIQDSTGNNITSISTDIISKVLRSNNTNNNRIGQQDHSPVMKSKQNHSGINSGNSRKQHYSSSDSDEEQRIISPNIVDTGNIPTSSDELIDTQPHEIPNKNNTNTDSKYKVKNECKNKILELIFEARKTSLDDVYKLFLLYPKDSTNKVFKTTFIDIACIPDITTSKICKTIFNNSSKALIKCKYDIRRSKWIPQIVDGVYAHPNKVSDLEMYFNII